MSQPKFIDGLIIKKPHPNAPEFIKAKISIKRAELIAYLQGQTSEWINADLKESKEGKLYAQIDDWKPNGGTSTQSTQNTPYKSNSDATGDAGEITLNALPF